MIDYAKILEIVAIALVVLCVAALIALIVGSTEAVEAERAAWFAECLERGNDPTWCRESEEHR